MSELIDLDALAAPLDGPAGVVGEDLRLAADAQNFFQLKDLRAEARTAEREAAADPEGETSVLDAGAGRWRSLVDLSAELLTTQTKDLEIAGWLCEGLTRLEGFQGLADGLTLVDQLLLRFWNEGVYPSEDEDGVETRIAGVGGLLGLSGAAALLQPVKLLPISDRDPGVAQWALASAQAPLQGGGDDAQARERATARRSERLEKVQAAVRRSSPAFLRDTYAQIRAALASIASITATVDRVARTGPFGAQIIEPLQSVLAYYEDQVGDVVRGGAPAAAAPEGEDDGASAPSAAPGSAGGAPAGAGRIGGREEAYAAVLRIADFFETSEPQSLTAQGLREVVRRGRMPLEELLAELLPDAGQRVLFLQRAGVKSETPVEESGY